MASIFRARATVMTMSGELESYGSGPNTSRNAAIAELAANLATVVGASINSVTISEQPNPSDVALALHGDSGQFEDAVLVLFKMIDGKPLEKTLTLENVALAYKSELSNLVDTTMADMQNIATNYHDGQGVGGYSFYPGKSYFKN